MTSSASDHSDLNSSQIVAAYYSQHYDRLHTRGPLGRASANFHKGLERPHIGKHYPQTLELGAGNMTHFSFVRHSFDRYLMSDIRDAPQCDLLNRPDLEYRSMDAGALDLSDQSFDRVVATCLILHLPDPLGALREWQRVCRSGGVVDYLVPCDPGVTSRLFRRMISEAIVGKHGVSREEYRLINALEHVSSFPRVWEISRQAVRPDNSLSIEFFPFSKVQSWNINAYAIFRISVG